jgi:tripartite-type tricarboxylate transporter receptor subunit TctC
LLASGRTVLIELPGGIMSSLRRGGVAVLVACCSTGWPALAFGQAFPAKPVRIVVPYTPGGLTDTVTRHVAQKMQEGLGQNVLVENRPGAGTIVAADYVAKQAPDGYTTFLGTTSLAINPTLYGKVPYDAFRDFAPVGMMARSSFVMMVHPSLPVTNVKAFIALARQYPGKLDYSSSGSGAVNHLCGELFKSMAGVKMNHIPYKGGIPAAMDLMAGQVQVMFPATLEAIGHLRTGKVRALGISGAKRSPALPDIPTIAEAGLPGYDATFWQALFVPAGTPAAAIQRIHAELARAVGSKELRDKLDPQGAELESGSPAELTALLKAETARWSKVVRDSGARAE